MTPKLTPYKQFVASERQFAYENRMAFMSQLVKYIDYRGVKA